MPVAPTRVAIHCQSAGFGNRGRFRSSVKIGLHRAAGSSYRWQDNSASEMPPVAAFQYNQQPAHTSSNYGTFAAERKRDPEKRAISVEVFRVIARSERISPTAEENLNPCPENPAARMTCGYSGWASMMKCSSGVIVYMHVAA